MKTRLNTKGPLQALADDGMPGGTTGVQDLKARHDDASSTASCPLAARFDLVYISEKLAFCTHAGVLANGSLVSGISPMVTGRIRSSKLTSSPRFVNLQ